MSVTMSMARCQQRRHQLLRPSKAAARACTARRGDFRLVYACMLTAAVSRSALAASLPPVPTATSNSLIFGAQGYTVRADVLIMSLNPDQHPPPLAADLTLALALVRVLYRPSTACLPT